MGGLGSSPPYSKRYRAPAPLPAFRYKVKGGQKVTALYGALADGWRVGVIAEFRYGTEFDGGPTVWMVRAAGHGLTVFEAANLAGVRRLLEDALEEAGVVSIEVGEPWCGYPSMTVRYADGSVLVDRYDGCARVESLTGGRKPARCRELLPELGGLAAF